VAAAAAAMTALKNPGAHRGTVSSAASEAALREAAAMNTRVAVPFPPGPSGPHESFGNDQQKKKFRVCMCRAAAAAAAEVGSTEPSCTVDRPIGLFLWPGSERGRTAPIGISPSASHMPTMSRIIPSARRLTRGQVGGRDNNLHR
jgi:hypothetical protein